MDEGKRAFSVYKERSDAKGLPTIDTVLAKLREFQIGVVVADQEPKKLTDSLLANTHTKVLFHIGDHDQFRRMAETMDLDRRQREFATDLGVGHAVIRSGVDAPVPVDLHDTVITKTVTDTELQQQMAPVWDRLGAATVSEPADTEAAEDTGEPGDLPAKPAEIVLSDDADQLLRDIADHPFKTHTERYELFSETSPYRGVTAKDELDEQGLIQEYTTVDESGERKLLDITETGRTYLDAHGVDISYRGRGGVVHRYWQHRICGLFQDHGYAAQIEADNADVAVRANGGRIAIEVAMRDRRREMQHVTDRLDAGFDGVIIACRNPNVRRGLQERLDTTNVSTERVELRLFRDFFSLDNLLS